MISDNLVKLVEQSEGFSEIPYRDSVGVPTIGFGFTHYPDGTPVTMQDAPMGKEFAIGLLHQLLQQYINGVNALCPNCNQNQRDALTDFAYNLGLGSLRASTLLKLVLMNPNNPEIGDEFNKWVHAGGKVEPGLVTRRANEAKLYFTPINQSLC